MVTNRLGSYALIVLGICLWALSSCTRKSDYTTELDLGGRKVNYIDDIEPIIASKCLDCHGNPPRDGAPAGTQYTSFNDVVTSSDDIYARLIDLTMPPPDENNALTATEIKLVKLWIETGHFLSADDTVGGIQPFNMVMNTLTSPVTSPDNSLPVNLAFSGFTAHDRLFLYYDSDNQGADGVLITGDIPLSSQVRVDWQIGTLPKNSIHYLYAVVIRADGTSHILYSDFALTIPDRNSLPLVHILTPTPDTAITDSQLSITWTQTDLDGDAMTTSISYRADSAGAFVPLVTDQVFLSPQYIWDLSQLVTSSQYYIKIDVKDAGGGINSAITGPFSIVTGNLPTYIGNIASIINFHCNECHSKPPDFDAPDSFALESYEEVVEYAERIRVRTIEEKTMPPEEEAPMSAEDLETLLLWIQSGMPRGEINLPPSFAFLNLLTDEISTNDQFTIIWNANDFDNNAVISLYYYLESLPADTVVIVEELREDSATQYLFTTDKLPSDSRLKILATISDGVNPMLTIAATGALVVENRNASPSVTFTSPAPYEALTDSTYTVAWSGTDPESDPLTVSLYYKLDSLSELISMVQDQSIITQTFEWDISLLNTGAEYALFVKVTDPQGLSDWDSVFNIAIINGNIPTYFGTIKSIIEFKCNNCHGVPPKEEAPDTFNLLTYEEVVKQKDNIIIRTIEERTMPPVDFEDLTPEEREQLTIWLQSGMLLGGANLPPSFEFISPTGTQVPLGESFTITWSAQDIDNNAVINLYWVSAYNPVDTTLIVEGLREDTDSSWDFNTGGVPGNTDIQVLATIYDGVNDLIWVGSKGIIKTEDRNTVPTITLTAPAGGEIFTSGSIEILFSATDPDGDLLNISLEYSTDSITYIPITQVSNTNSHNWDVSAMAFGLSYFLRAIVTDTPAGASDTADSKKFGIAHTPAFIPTFWATVKPIFDAKCNACHQSPYSENAPETFDLSLYTRFGVTNGSIEKKDQIQTQVLQDLMPPKAEPDLTAFETQQIIHWVMNGTPEGQEGVSEPPTLTFTYPVNTNEQVVDDLADLKWTALDPDNDAAINLYYDTDAAGFNGTLIVSGLKENTVSNYIWNTNTILSDATYFVYASISDGINDTVWTYAAGSLFVPARSNSPPVVQISSPAGGESFTTGSVDIAWSASDLDGDNLNITLFYDLSDNNWIQITAMGNTGSHTWSTSGLENGTDYRVRVLADDGKGLTGEDITASITIHSGGTIYRYNDQYIKPFFDTYCTSCHSGRSAPKRLKLDTYQGITTPDTTLVKIQKEMYVDEAMPPREEPQPTQEERDRVLDWILGGAPQ